MKPSRTFPLVVLILLALASIPLVGVLALTSGQTAGGAAVPERAGLVSISHDDLIALPACGGLARGEETDEGGGWEIVAPDALGDENIVGAQREDAFTFVDDSTLEEPAGAGHGFINLPTKVPGWTSCQAVDFGYNSEGDGYLSLELWDHPDRDTATRVLGISVSAHAPSDPRAVYPGDIWALVQTSDEMIQEAYESEGSVLGASAEEQTDIVGATDLIWVDTAGHFYELSGPVYVDQAIEIAESVEPLSA